MILPLVLFLGSPFVAGQDVQRLKDIAPDSGYGLYMSCKLATREETSLSEVDHLRLVSCLTYTIGVFQGYYLGSANECLPKALNNTELAMIVTRYMDVHPEIMNENPSVITVRALKTAFPCVKTKKSN